jgi:hypothetical protein
LLLLIPKPKKSHHNISHHIIDQKKKNFTNHLPTYPRSKAHDDTSINWISPTTNSSLITINSHLNICPHNRPHYLWRFRKLTSLKRSKSLDTYLAWFGN